MTTIQSRWRGVLAEFPVAKQFEEALDARNKDWFEFVSNEEDDDDTDDDDGVA